MQRYFVGKAHPDVQDAVLRSMDEVAAKLLQLGEERFEAHLGKYRHRGEPSSLLRSKQGVRELWKWLSLIHLLWPDWQFTESEYANLELQDDFIHLLYSMQEDSMRDIVFDFAEQLLGGTHRPSFAMHGFPRRLILGNAYLEEVQDDDENLCEHCRPAKQPPLFHQIVADMGQVQSRGVLQGVDANRIGEVRITCHDCLHRVRELPDLEAILRRLGEVI